MSASNLRLTYIYAATLGAAILGSLFIVGLYAIVRDGEAADRIITFLTTVVNWALPSLGGLGVVHSLASNYLASKGNPGSSEAGASTSTSTSASTGTGGQ